jgi:agmatine deiminase
MLADSATDKTYFAECLDDLYGVTEAKAALRCDTEVRTIPNCANIWCRDFMPIQIDVGRFVQFRYSPSYLRDAPNLVTPPEVAQAVEPIRRCKELKRTDIVLDGGNVVHWTDAAILTDAIYRENPSVPRTDLRQRIADLLEVSRLIIVPKEPRDVCAHTDGMLRFVSADTILVNRYAGQYYAAFRRRLQPVLRRHKLTCIELPYRPSDEIVDGMPSAEGNYVNFLQVGRTILAPVYRYDEDDKALSVLSAAFPDSRIIPIYCNDLARKGGVLNCVSWTIKA